MNKFVPLLPLLIPSFSSKGNLLLPTENGKYVSDNYDLLRALDIRVSKTYLISAYDVFYYLMPQEPSEWPQAEYLFVDSGGYETNDAFDLSERHKYNYKVFPWDAKMMKAVYQRVASCPKFQNTNLIFSAFDNNGSFNEQLKNALFLKSQFSNAIIDFIVKLTFPVQCLLDGINQEKNALQNFSILGFTEKELGNTVRERILNLISIKECLYKCGWHGYIHVFGGLEPNLVKLYYFAGADIFDGLSWQRMRFSRNSTLFDPREYNVSRSEQENQYWMMVDNLAFLQNFSSDLSIFSVKRPDYAEKIKNSLQSDDISMQKLSELLEG